MALGRLLNLFNRLSQDLRHGLTWSQCRQEIGHFDLDRAAL